MRSVTYFDTSALAKWYLREARSDDVEKYIQEHGPVDISDLTLVEMRSLLARRRREGNIDPKMEIQIFATFEEDIRQNFLIVHTLPNGWATAAVARPAATTMAASAVSLIFRFLLAQRDAGGVGRSLS
jgi:predicted nucleic acid-binding protein